MVSNNLTNYILKKTFKTINKLPCFVGQSVSKRSKISTIILQK